jgi:hypothetical protein
MVTFTRHALIRVFERLHLSEKEIAQILDSHICVLLGRDGDSTKVHKLFFSRLDNSWFVAVLDESNNEVLTILPSDYHNRWRISSDALDQARALVQGGKKTSGLVERLMPGVALSFRFSAVLENKQRKIRTVGLGSVPCKGYSSVVDASEDQNVQELLRERLADQITESEKVVVILGRIGKKNPTTRLAITTPYDR